MALSTYVGLVKVIHIHELRLVGLVVRALGNRKTAHTRVVISEALVNLEFIISLVIDINAVFPEAIEVSDHVAEGGGNGVVDVAVLCLSALAAVLGCGSLIRKE